MSKKPKRHAWYAWLINDPEVVVRWGARPKVTSSECDTCGHERPVINGDEYDADLGTYESFAFPGVKMERGKLYKLTLTVEEA
jgi:hypothetical protein